MDGVSSSLISQIESCGDNVWLIIDSHGDPVSMKWAPKGLGLICLERPSSYFANKLDARFTLTEISREAMYAIAQANGYLQIHVHAESFADEPMTITVAPSA